MFSMTVLLDRCHPCRCRLLTDQPKSVQDSAVSYKRLRHSLIGNTMELTTGTDGRVKESPERKRKFGEFIYDDKSTSGNPRPSPNINKEKYNSHVLKFDTTTVVHNRLLPVCIDKCQIVLAFV